MRKGLTELVFIIDRSGSMAGLESDTIGGFNAMIEKQKQLPGKCYVSTVLFASDIRVLHDRVDITSIQPMTAHDFTVGGCTALYDAIGGAIRHIGNIHKYARPEDVPSHTIFAITTDGMENASRSYNRLQIKESIERQTEKHGWEFLFLAANIDAEETADSIGIRKECAVEYLCDCGGIAYSYEAMDRALHSVRSGERLDEDWKTKKE